MRVSFRVLGLGFKVVIKGIKDTLSASFVWFLSRVQGLGFRVEGSEF